ncbi:MAG: NUDIX domain-containing protein [Streptomycetales bacterium]
MVDKPDFALIIPDEEGGFHLVEEYRYPVRRRTWAFPQGTLPDREDGDPEELARTELAQETGLRAGRLASLGFLHCSHGTSGHGCHATSSTTPPSPPTCSCSCTASAGSLPQAECVVRGATAPEGGCAGGGTLGPCSPP